MRLGRALPATTVVMVLLGGCATAPLEPPEGAILIEAEFPPPGTKWVTRSVDQTRAATTTTWTVLEEESYKGKPVYRVSDGTVTWLYDRATRNRVAVLHDDREVLTMSPHEGTFAWPLWVGKSWSASFAASDHTRGASFNPVESTWKVEARMPISVPAGSFDALRLQSSPGRNHTARVTIWYAPEIKLVVKTVEEAIRPSLRDPLRERRIVTELLEYHPAPSAFRSRPSSSSPAALLAGPTTVPIRVVGNLTLVDATFNRSERALLIVDTGSSSTIITPVLMRRLGLSLPEEASRTRGYVVGGQMLSVPMLAVAAIQVGDAVVENFEVGVHDVFPKAPDVDGLLGGDFLHRFRITLDKDARQMRLEPLVQGLAPTVDAPRRPPAPGSRPAGPWLRDLPGLRDPLDPVCLTVGQRPKDCP